MILHVLPHQTRKNLSINLQKWLIDTNIFDESFILYTAKDANFSDLCAYAMSQGNFF